MEAWDENARELAAAVTAATAQTGAEMLVIGGDIKARSLLLDHLAPPLRDHAVIVDREVPADSDLLAEAAARTQAEEEARRRLEEFRSKSARGRAPRAWRRPCRRSGTARPPVPNCTRARC